MGHGQRPSGSRPAGRRVPGIGAATERLGHQLLYAAIRPAALQPLPLGRDRPGQAATGLDKPRRAATGLGRGLPPVPGILCARGSKGAGPFRPRG